MKEKIGAKVIDAIDLVDDLRFSTQRVIKNNDNFSTDGLFNLNSNIKFDKLKDILDKIYLEVKDE